MKLQELSVLAERIKLEKAKLAILRFGTKLFVSKLPSKRFSQFFKQN